MTCFLAIEGGGTRTTGGFYQGDTLVAEGTTGPSNPLAYGTTATAGAIAELAGQLFPDAQTRFTLLAGIAGVMSENIARDIAAQLTGLPGLERVVMTTDLHPLLYAHASREPGILVIAGTGASILAHDGNGKFRRFGGRGPIMGDDGSAYQIAVAALRAVARAEDETGPPTALQACLPTSLGLVHGRDLIPWSLAASKQHLAALARVVSDAADDGDAVALACIQTQADRLAELTRAASGSLPGRDPIPLWTQGGVVEHCPGFRSRYLTQLATETRLVPRALEMRGHAAVATLRTLPDTTDWCYQFPMDRGVIAPTERQSRDIPPIDALPAVDFVNLMIRQEGLVARALGQQAAALAQVTVAAAHAIRSGGRLIYLGAGTSGRLGVLDASECPPTFGTAPRQVVGLIAGGDDALRTGVEGAEDDRALGVADLKALHPSDRDIVIGIAASGTTPYVLAALSAARDHGCVTALLCCNPQVGNAGIDHLIALPTGPEALPGSTRLNAGTATKVALNIISTGAMAQSGYVYAGHMVKMRPSNEKLRARAIRMVSTLTGAPESECARLLTDCGYEIPIALIAARLGIPVSEARQCYDEAEQQLYPILKDCPLP